MSMESLVCNLEKQVEIALINERFIDAPELTDTVNLKKYINGINRVIYDTPRVSIKKIFILFSDLDPIYHKILALAIIKTDCYHLFEYFMDELLNALIWSENRMLPKEVKNILNTLINAIKKDTSPTIYKYLTITRAKKHDPRYITKNNSSGTCLCRAFVSIFKSGESSLQYKMDVDYD